MRRCLKVWPSQRRHLPNQLRRPTPKVPGQHLSAPLKRKLLQGWQKNPLWRRGPWSNFLVGKRCYIPPDPWWLLGRSPICQEVQGWGKKGWFKSLKLKDRRWQSPHRKPLGGRSYVSPWGGDYEYKLHHEGWGDRGHLHGHSNHLSRDSGPQWPWTGNLDPGAQDTRHNRPHLRSSWITTFGWWGWTNYHCWVDKPANDHLWVEGL